MLFPPEFKAKRAAGHDGHEVTDMADRRYNASIGVANMQISTTRDIVGGAKLGGKTVEQIHPALD